MTTERQAKCLMLLAMALVVWACSSVGCAVGGGGESGWGSGLNTASAREPVAPRTIADGDEAISEAAAPAEADFVLFDLGQSRGPWVGSQDESFERHDEPWSGLSISQPLWSAKSLQISQKSSAVQGPGVDRLGMFALGISLPSELRPVWPDHGTTAASAVISESNPLPLPVTKSETQKAITDEAWILGVVLGGMALFFAGEVGVLWCVHRRRAIAPSGTQRDSDAYKHEPQPSSFRFPKPVDGTNELPESPKRAA
ncbi:MAG: hypothetical protein AAGG38_01845 [Planctomycetota bacterium]